MAGKMSLVEQKRIQWAKERDEMARLSGSWGFLKHDSNIHANIGTCQIGAAMSVAEINNKRGIAERFRAVGHYGSNVSLKSLATESFESGIANLKCVDYNGDSLTNLPGQLEMSRIRRRSPSLPPIHSKDQQQYFGQARHSDFGIEGSRYDSRKLQVQHDHPSYQRYENRRKTPYVSQSEEREGETSGYASDSVDVPVAATGTLLPGCKPPGADTNGKTWQNPYCATPENSLPPSRRLSDGRIGELNRPRWDSVRGQDTFRGDPPPPPSWLSRLGHASQVLIINHDSASSSDSSTTGSTGSNKTNTTHLRGQNIPVDVDVLRERETRRQKALDLQNAIKQQLEEKERQRKEEKERRLREEYLEEERIKRERERERERFEEERKRLDEKEAADLKRAETMREMIEAAERLAKEEKKIRRKRNEAKDGNIRNPSKSCESNIFNDDGFDRLDSSASIRQDICSSDGIVTMSAKDRRECDRCTDSEGAVADNLGKPEERSEDARVIRVPISKDVQIVLSGRLEDSELVNNNSNLRLVNFVLDPSPRRFEGCSNNSSVGLDEFMRNVASQKLGKNSGLSPIIVENRLLTPSKYRTLNGRDFGTQTEVENDLETHRRERVEESTIKDTLIKERKDTTNVNRRDVEKCTNVGPVEEIGIKTLSRSKSQPRASIESRPRWNANRPGTRYRTQSEKDPHYQRRLRLRRRQIESSDERSRSPSPDRRKLGNVKPKCRAILRGKAKLDSYDADLSMDSLNSIVPLRTDQNGRINIESNDKFERRSNDDDDARLDNDRVNEADRIAKSENGNSNVWCGQEILSKLSSLRTLDDLLKDDKKDANLLPDLSKTACGSQEEFRRLLENCLEFKIKPEKVKRDDTKVRDKEFSWKSTRKELRAVGREWGYGDPVPPDMRDLNLGELQQVAIDWRMLTPIRPKHRQDEEMFSRLVEMGKLEAKTIVKELNSSRSPIRRTKNRAGIIESSVKICVECGEEFCFGEFCGDVLYDSFTRVTITNQQPKAKISADTEAIIANMDRKKKSRKKGKKKRAKSKGRTPRKSIRLFLIRKGKKPMMSNSGKIRANKSKREDEERCLKPAKPFKRKCGKYMCNAEGSQRTRK